MGRLIIFNNNTDLRAFMTFLKFLQTLRLLTGILLLAPISAIGQTIPNSITITRITYVTRFLENSDTVYRREIYSIVLDGKTYKLNNKKVKKSKIQILLNELSKSNNSVNSLAKYGIDTSWIINNPSKLLELYSDKEDIDWNEPQKQFIFKELTDISNFREYLNDRLLDGGSYTMHHSYKNEYQIKIFIKGNEPSIINSRKYVWGYMMPWAKNDGEQIFNYNIETALNNILSNKIRTKDQLSGSSLLKYLINKIVDNNLPSLYQLSAYSYQKEIDELKTDFTIVGAGEVYVSGGYMKDGQSAIKIALKNKLMFDNVSAIFFASKQGKTIYSRDSLKRDYKQYIDRIQTIPFITDYLKSNPKSKLDIYYFNNKGINDDNIDNINKSPKQWKQHDDYLKSLETSQKLGVKSSFDIDEAIKTSQQVYCGCNYRYDKSYLEKAILFKIVDENGNSSIWLLLPDNKVLLYLMQGDRVLNFNYQDFGNSRGLQYPCKLFDFKGKTIPK